VAFDPILKKVLCYGGYSSTNAPVRETLTWDGTTWALLSTPTTPTNASGWLRPLPDEDALMFVSQRFTATGFTDIVFRWTGSTWEAMPDRLPAEWSLPSSGLVGEWVVSELTRGRTVSLMNDMVITGEAKRLGVDQRYPRPGGMVNLSLSIPSEARNYYILALSEAGYPGIPVLPLPGGGSRVLPLAPDALFTASLQAGLAGQLGGAGTATQMLAIPNLPELAWHDVHCAAVSFDSNFRPRTVTNRVTLNVLR